MVADNLIINLLHVQARRRSAVSPGSGSTVGLRVGLEQALGRLRPRPAYLPPHAILVIRSLVSRAAYGSTAADRQRWLQQLEDQIDELARQALRPGRQHVPPDANCVLFDDEVALLLCYTRDLLAGRWAWYWEELFPAAAEPGQTAGGRLLSAWQIYPQAVPHTLAGLRPAAAAAALYCLKPAELSRLVHCLHDTFALPRGALEASARVPMGAARPCDRVAVAAPWQEWLPAPELRGLAPPATYLLGLCHTLVRRPQQARGLDFGQQARRWLEEASSSASPAAPGERYRSGEGQPAAGPVALRSARDLPATRQDGELSAAPASASDPVPAPVFTSAAEDRAGQQPTGEHRTSAEGDLRPSTGLGTGAFTRLGGAIYLVNLLSRLGLPGSIPALAGLNPWELLGGLAAGLLGRRLPAFAADPLWAIVSELAGQEPGRPWGESLPAPAAFRLPAAWLDLLPPGQAAAIRAAAPSLEEPPELAAKLMAQNLAWWVQRLRPYVAVLLDHLLGRPADAVETLLHQPGTLYVSRTHVDLLLSVEQISIPVRRAGLDQTPGWRPEFGYIITIHFE
jgi:hypothetical protein